MAKKPQKIQKLSQPGRYPDELFSAFLEHYAKSLSITEACRDIGCTRMTIWSRKQIDPEFSKKFDEIFEHRTSLLEDEAYRRAFAGSDTLLIFLLKGNTEKYRDIGNASRVALSGSVSFKWEDEPDDTLQHSDSVSTAQMAEKNI